MRMILVYVIFKNVYINQSVYVRFLMYIYMCIYLDICLQTENVYINMHY